MGVKNIPDVLYIFPYPRQRIEPADLWRGVDDWWKWYAINSDGEGVYYDHEPIVEGNRWGWNGGASTGLNHDMNGIDWRGCLWVRPDTVQDDDPLLQVELIELSEEDLQLLAAYNLTRDLIWSSPST